MSLNRPIIHPQLHPHATYSPYSMFVFSSSPLDNPLSEHTFLSSRPSSLPSANNASSSSASNPSASSPAATYSSSFPSWVSSPYASFPNSTSSFGSNANSLIGIKEGSDAGKKKAGYDDGHLRQMVAHSSLDLIEDAMVGGNM